PCRSAGSPAGPFAEPRPLLRPRTSAAPLRLDHAVAPRHVRRDLEVLVAEVAQQAGDARCLVLGDLEDNPAAGPQSFGSRAGNRLGRAVRDERDPGLPVAHLRLERLDVLRLDVWRVGDDEIECVVAEAFGQVVLDEANAAV